MGEHHIQYRPGQVHPKVADGAGLGAHETADQGEQHGDACACGDKVLDGQAHGLGEVGEGDLPGIGLPVGIGGEAGGGVKGQVPAQPLHALGVPRQQVLEF